MTATNAVRSTALVRAVRVCVLLVPLLDTACTSTSPLKLQSRAPRQSQPTVHVVQRGDTLFKIAWQYRIDQRELARWNGLRDPDVIRVGQSLRLTPPRTMARSRERPPSAAAPATRVEPARTPASAPSRAAPSPPPQWLWPTDGSVVTRFGSRDGIATGIGIRGREGQPVKAAAAGRVVYVGSGLIGYGQLVIIKHSDVYLSAYGYASRVLVSQGQDVARGATIAYMGQGPGREPRLHFEIRRDGVPLDPLLLVDEP